MQHLNVAKIQQEIIRCSDEVTQAWVELSDAKRAYDAKHKSAIDKLSLAQSKLSAIASILMAPDL